LITLELRRILSRSASEGKELEIKEVERLEDKLKIVEDKLERVIELLNS